MSDVTCAIIIAGLTEEVEVDDVDTVPPVETLNSLLEEKGFPTFRRVDDHAGGGKSFEAAVFMLAANRLSVEELTKMVWAQSWKDRERVQLYLKRDEEDVFTEYRYGL